MTPADIAKVRNVVSIARSDAFNNGRSELVDRLDSVRDILDAEAKRKTRTYWRVEYRDDDGAWRAPRNPAMAAPFNAREDAESMIRHWIIPGRILEVTESWKEPT